MKKILGIYGAGGLGRELLELARIINKVNKRWDEIVFIVDGPCKRIVNGINVYSFEEAVDAFSGTIEVSIGVGEPIDRERLFEKIKSHGICAATLIHPLVHVPGSTSFGSGVTIQYGCFISCNVEIQDYVYIQPQVNIGHDCKLMKGCVVSGMANLAGRVSIGEFSYIGMSAVVKENIYIGNYSIIGMASVIYKDVQDEVIVVGNPARVMQKNESHMVFDKKESKNNEFIE